MENNVVVLTNFTCPSSGETVEAKGFTLPADAWKDYNTLDWVLAYQQPDLADSTELAFNDLMKNQYNNKAATGGLSGKDLFLANSNLDKTGSNSLIDH